MKHDDQVDATAWIGLTLDKITLAKTEAEWEEEEWEEEMYSSGATEQGRSTITGY